MRRALILVLPAVLLVAACGAGSSSGETQRTATALTAAAPAAPAPATTGTAAAPAGAAAAGVKLVKVGSFDMPVYVTGAPGDTGRVFVVEQGGRIRVVRDGQTEAAPFLDIRDHVTSGGEQGLLSMAFAPDYATSGRFYVYYTDKAQNERVVEYRRGASPDVADPGSARNVLVMKDPEPNHNGGQLQFGPDGLLYIGTGDGGGGNDQHGARGNGQNLGSLLAKILRIDPTASGGKAYTVPADNPFVRNRSRPPARPEIYAYGLRNPWRFSFDRATGDLTIGDVGEHAVEEIDFRRKGTGRGVNFGWRPWEGRRRNFQEPAPHAVFPVITHNHDDDWCSIVGGYVVRDPSVPALKGTYVYGDYCGGRVWSATLKPGKATGDRRMNLPALGQISSFGQDTAGHVYVATLGGSVYRFASR